MEKTLIILKPDCMEKNLVGEVLKRFAQENLVLKACKMTQLSECVLREHYGHLTHLDVFPLIVAFMRERPVVVAVLEGDNAIARVRALAGPTDSQAAPKGTIRGDLGTDKRRNILHASDSPESASAEMRRFFNADEIF